MKYTPRQDFVILQMDEPIQETKTGILLSKPESDERLPGTVLAIGPGRMTEHGCFLTIDNLKVGDRVVFNKFSALELDTSDRTYMMRANDIGCVIND